jgi:tagatose kinase
MDSVFVIGEILVEIMAEQKGQSFGEAGLFEGPYVSGAPAIFIDQVAKFGVPAAIISAVGNDDFGRMCSERLSHDGVSTRFIKVVPHIATGVAFVRYNNDGSRNFIFHLNNAACGDVKQDDLAKIDVSKAKVFHIMGSSIFNEEMFLIHQKVITMLPKECLVSFDPNVRPEILDANPALNKLILELFEKATILFVTEEELEFLTNKTVRKKALQTCFEKGIEVVVIKKGSKGASAFTREKEITVDSLPVREIDPTGAGDTFAGAFVAGYVQGWPIETCLERANTAGASAVSKKGPMEGTLTLDELEKFNVQ